MSGSRVGCRIFIGRLNPSAREKDVERFFKGYGKVRDIDLKRGFGFVEFEDPRDADDAVYELDGKELCNERVTIEHARVRSRGGGRGRGGGGGRFSDRYGSRRSRDDRRNGPPIRTDNRLIVENLSSRVSWQDLKDFMRQAGEVTFAEAHRPKLNEGLVEFASYSDLKNALEKLSGKEINGRKIRLIEGNLKR
nr:PREDICTED: serine/arginine-rich splicing factor 5-like isoform X2 [Latimeria chalumnae]|eukprot:XP_005990828.1 PREDICTED: serine/arginine-rich splicing factor 5-like isoform X2 [Latimeria chalumnae]